MAIDHHPSLQLIEVDGSYIHPHDISYLELNSGQRYSFLLRTKTVEEIEALNQTVFWANLETRWRSTRDYGGFILRYQLPTPSSTSSNITIDTSLGAMNTTPNVEVTEKTRDRATLPPEAYAPLPQLNKTIPLPNESPFWVIPELKPLDENDVPPGDEEVSRKVFVDMQQQNASAGAGLRVWWWVDGYQVRIAPPLACLPTSLNAKSLLFWNDGPSWRIVLRRPPPHSLPRPSLHLPLVPPTKLYRSRGEWRV